MDVSHCKSFAFFGYNLTACKSKGIHWYLTASLILPVIRRGWSPWWWTTILAPMPVRGSVGEHHFSTVEDKYVLWKKHLPPPYTRGRRPLCRSPSWGHCCPHLCCSLLWLSWCWVLRGGWSQSERECCKSRTRWLRLIRSARTSCRTFDFPVPSVRPQQFL